MEDEDQTVDQPAESKKTSLKIPKQKKQKTKGKTGKTMSKKPEKVSSGTTECKYVPEEYSQTRKAFIDKLRSDGISFSIAASAWNVSKQKRELLSGLSVSELKRRRFLPKEAEANPWAK